MPSSEMKTKETGASVEEFLAGLEDERRREDCFALLEVMRGATGLEPRMWGTSIVGFGRYRYRYESGREGEWFLTGFSPRKGDLTVYITSGFEAFPELMAKLGKFKTGKSCLYVKKLADVDPAVLRELVKRSAETARLHSV